MKLDYYDAGLLSDYGGGDIDWWQNYIRDELDRSYRFYQDQCDDANTKSLDELLAMKTQIESMISARMNTVEEVFRNF